MSEFGLMKVQDIQEGGMTSKKDLLDNGTHTLMIDFKFDRDMGRHDNRVTLKLEASNILNYIRNF